MLLITLIIAFVALLISTITDIQRREVPDYVSYGLIFVGTAAALIDTVISWNYIPVSQSMMGFIIGLAIAYGMFYLGQWGGGDSKLLMGLGAVFGFNAFYFFGEQNYWLLIFVAGIILIGALYGLVWSVFLAFVHKREFLQGMKYWLSKKEIKIIRYTLMVLIILAFITILVFVPIEYQGALVVSLCALYIIFYVWLFVKVIEETCMIKELAISKLTEGDWIYKDVYIGKELITGPKELGISKEQIEILKKHAKNGKIKTVVVKEGIPFVPVFLLAYIGTLILYFLGIF